MPSTLTLNERRKSPPLELSRALRAGLEHHFAATITTGPTADTFVVTPGDTVGSLTIDTTTVVVAPKVPIDRVLFMVAYANDPYGWKEGWASIVDSNDLVEGMAALFAHTCDRVLARGLYRSYRRVEADAPAVRGRIRWQRQARRPGPLPIAVRYDVHDDDVLENQLVRAALAVLRSLPIRDPGTTAAIARRWRDFHELAVLPHPHLHVDKVAWNRQNEHYSPLIGLARIILEGSMGQIDPGAVPVPGFTVNMPQVFERFVRTVLREQSVFTPDEFPDDPHKHDLHLDTAGRVKLLPDLGVQVRHRWRFIGDVKYKRDDGPGHQADLYQLVAYATAAGLDEATLIYADGPGDAPHHSVRNAGIQLHLVHLDLQQPPQAVLTQLAQHKVHRF